MASRSLQVKIIGDASSLERALGRAQTQTSKFGKTVEAQQKSLENLHRHVLGLAGTLIGAGGLEMGLKSVIEAARKAQESQDHLAVTMKDAGLSYDAAKKQVEGFIRKQSELAAFQQTDLRESFGTIVRVTKDTSAAMRDTALATDLARARHIDLATATNIVVKANLGMTGALRRMGIDIQPVHDAVNALTDSHKHFTTETKAAAKAMDQHATALKAIDQLSSTYAGHAKAYGESSQGAADKFKVALQNLQITVGEGLLPEINKLLGKVTPLVQGWVDSGKAAHDTKVVVHDLGIALHTVGNFAGIAEDAFHGFSDIVGGNRHAVELLTASLILFKVRGVGAMMTGIATSITGLDRLIAKEAEARAAGAGLPIGLAAGAAAVVTMPLWMQGDQGKLPGVNAAKYPQLAAGGGMPGLWEKAFAYMKSHHMNVDAYPRADYGDFVKKYPQLGSYLNGLVADAILPPTTTHGPGGAHGGATGVSGPGDFADESPAFKAALSNLSKRYGAITLDSGFRSEASQTRLWDASVKAGHPGYMPNGNPIARPASRGGAGSDHSRGTAGDGTIVYKGKRIPLSALPPSILAAYGLSTVPGDVGHVMLSGGGANARVTPQTNPSITYLLNQGTSTAKKIHAASGRHVLPAGIQIKLSAATGCTLLPLPNDPDFAAMLA